ncbi:MAG: hypothetical protein COY80_01690 [Candidatus Pacebacteria bacterium CG_4_10_14_0_8_um_filter_42_14]|nr:MAG: hypothetical protein COY80_01690 [Candidatus Pacebacteria bacterium CG_4_10_14_0_8_um_filter_42_14]
MNSSQETNGEVDLERRDVSFKIAGLIAGIFLGTAGLVLVSNEGREIRINEIFDRINASVDDAISKQEGIDFAVDDGKIEFEIRSEVYESFYIVVKKYRVELCSLPDNSNTAYLITKIWRSNQRFNEIYQKLFDYVRTRNANRV